MIDALFWLSALTVVYIYIGYPGCLWLLKQWRSRPIKKQDYLPSVTLLIPAFNEAGCIRETLENKLAQDYPAEKFNIIVISDESTDGTDDIVQQYANRNVTLIRQTPRQGKSAGLNLAVRKASGDILIFSDANSIYEPGAIRALVNNFADPAVGYVTGKMIYGNPDGSVTGDGCSAYMRYENFMRDQESTIGSVVGVDGGIDAMRRSLYRQLNADQLPDFVQPLRVVEQNHRVVYEPAAILREHALTDSNSEYRMRVRVSLRALWALYDMRHLMNPGHDVLFAWQLISHKLLRYLAFIPLLGSLLFSATLIPHSLFFALVFFGQVLFYGLALLGHTARSAKAQPAIIAIPYYFALLNIAALHAFIRFLKREKQVLWTPRVG